MKTSPNFKPLILAALKEDRAREDVTSKTLFKREKAHGWIIFKGTHGVLCGMDAVQQAFKIFDSSLKLQPLFKDGRKLRSGDKVLNVSGNAGSLLSCERTALNILGLASGIASKTRRLVDAAHGMGTKFVVSDTRKTHPLLRSLEKYAVAVGGGEPHRGELASMAMIKDNHLRIFKRIHGASWARELTSRVQTLHKRKIQVEIEVQDLGDLDAVIESRPDWIMLDNMESAQLQDAVYKIHSKAPRTKIEVSGGITLDNIGKLAGLSVHRASSGAIVHSAPFADFSLELF